MSVRSDISVHTTT